MPPPLALSESLAMLCGTTLAITQFAPSYKHATVM